jgi:GAF domain-containing protein
MQKIYSLDEFPLLLKVYTTQQPEYNDDLRDCTEELIIPGCEEASSYAAAPLIAAGQVIGFINVTSDQLGYFNEEIVARLTAFAVPAALAIHNARLYMAEKDARQVAETLSDSASALSQTLDQDQALRSVLDHINLAIAPDVSGIGLLDETYSLVVRASNGYALWNGPDYTFPIKEGTEPYALINQCITTGKSQQVPDTRGEPLEIDLPGVDHIRS